MIRIGLTGGIASGKSTISDYLGSMGAPVVDADKISREIMRGDVLAAVLKEFPSCAADGAIDRKKLGRIVFADADARRRLEAITLPAILSEAKARLVALEKAGAPAAIFDAPTLFESGADALVDVVWVVKGGDARLARLMRRDGIDREEAMRRINAQMPEEEKLARADGVIDNSGSSEAAMDAARELWHSAVQMV